MAGFDGYILSMFESAHEFIRKIDGALLAKNAVQFVPDATGPHMA